MTLILSGTDGLSDVDGSAATPAIRGTDANTGIFFPAADTIAFAEGGAEVARFDSSGNFGIGVTPSYRLEVKGPAATAGQLSIHDGTGDTTVSGNNAASLLFQTRDTSVRTVAEIDAVNTTTNGTGAALVFQTRITDTLAERMRIDSSGNVGIGTSSPSNRLQVYQNASAAVMAVQNQTTSLQLQVNDGVATGAGVMLINGAYPLTFWTNGSERMRIDSSGNLQFNSGYGSVATAYGCRAWVNFNGTGTVAIRASGNVSSITDNGTGDYTVNFTTAMPDANYAAQISITAANHYATSTGGNNSNFTYATNSFKPGLCISQGGVIYDPSQLNVSIFR